MRGLLPIAVGRATRTSAGLMFPDAEPAEAGIVEGLPLFPVRSLSEAARMLVSPNADAGDAAADRDVAAVRARHREDLADVRGQLLGRRALEIAAAGAHHLLFSGPPGAGKTMLARRLPGLLPPLRLDEALTVTTIHSVAGTLPPGIGPLMRAAVSRAAPHVLGHRARRRRIVSAARRTEPRARRRAVSRRAAGVQPPRRSRRCGSRSNSGVVHIARAARSVIVSGARHARRRDESVPVRLSRRPARARCRCPPARSSGISSGSRGRCAIASICGSICRRCRGPMRARRDRGESSAAVRARVSPRARATAGATGRAERRTRRRRAARAACPPMPSAEALLATGGRAARLSVRGGHARPASRPHDRRPGRTRRGPGPRTWQRPCTSDGGAGEPRARADYEIG